MFDSIRNLIVKVRKNHICVWCEDLILIGETAQYRVYKWEGDFQYDYQHTECHKAMLNAPADLIEEGWFPGEFIRGTSDIKKEYI